MTPSNRLALWVALSFAAGTAAAAEPPALKQTIVFPGKTGNLDHLAVDAKGGRLFVANKPNNTLDVIDLKTGRVVRQIPDQGKASGVAYAADLDRVFVGNGAGTCNAFDAAKDYAPVFSAKLPKADNVNYHPGARWVYVAHGQTLTALDAVTGEVKATVALPGDAHGFHIDSAGGKAYVSLTKPSQVGVVDLTTHEVTASFPLTLAAGNSPLAYDPSAGRVFVGCRKEPMVVILDARSGKEIGSVAIPGDIDDLLFDPTHGRLFAVCGAGGVAVIERTRETYAVTTTVETPKGSRTGTVDPSGERLYVGVPARGGKDPEIRVYAVTK
jgi:YVTN family beta-propeller protein